MVHITIMFQSVVYFSVWVMLNRVACESAAPPDQYEERIETLANTIQSIVVSQATRIALGKDAMAETVNEAAESIEKQLVELHEIADVIREKRSNRFCLETIKLINNISIDSLKACNYSSSFDHLNKIVENAAELYTSLQNVTRTCEVLVGQEDCVNQLLEGIESGIFRITESINGSIDRISGSYLSCIQEELKVIDKTLNNIGHRVQQCV